MVLKNDHEKVKSLLTETITLLCKNALTFKTKFTVEGLIGITLDEDQIILISINETTKNINFNTTNENNTLNIESEKYASNNLQKTYSQSHLKQNKRKILDDTLNNFISPMSTSKLSRSFNNTHKHSLSSQVESPDLSFIQISDSNDYTDYITDISSEIPKTYEPNPESNFREINNSLSEIHQKNENDNHLFSQDSFSINFKQEPNNEDLLSISFPEPNYEDIREEQKIENSQENLNNLTSICKEEGETSNIYNLANIENEFQIDNTKDDNFRKKQTKSDTKILRRNNKLNRNSMSSCFENKDGVYNYDYFKNNMDIMSEKNSKRIVTNNHFQKKVKYASSNLSSERDGAYKNNTDFSFIQPIFDNSSKNLYQISNKQTFQNNKVQAFDCNEDFESVKQIISDKVLYRKQRHAEYMRGWRLKKNLQNKLKRMSQFNFSSEN